MGPSWIQAKTLSPDGRWIGFSTTDGATWLLDVKSGKKIALLSCDEYSVQALAFRPDSSMLAVGDGNGIIRLFEVPSGQELKELHESEWVLQLAFDGPNYLKAGGNFGLSVWDISLSRRLTLIPEIAYDPVEGWTRRIYDNFDLSPDRKLLATSGRFIHGIEVRNLAGGVTARIPAPDETTSYVFRPERASILFVADKHGDISSWDARTGRLLNKIPAHLHPYTRLAFLPGSDFQLVTNDFPSVKAWNADTGKLMETWNATNDRNFLSPDGKWEWIAETGSIEPADPVRNEVLKLGNDALKGLRYKSTVTPWKVDNRILVARLMAKEPSSLSLAILFLGLGALGYVLCRCHRWLIVPSITFTSLYAAWWLRELFWPATGPRLFPHCGVVLIIVSLAAMVTGIALQMVGAIRSRGHSKSRLFVEWKWVLPLVQVALGILLIWITPLQKQVDFERLQLTARQRAWNQNVAAPDAPWYYGLPPGDEIAAALSLPPVAVFLGATSWLDSLTQRFAPIIRKVILGVLAASLMFTFWWFVGTILDGGLRPKSAILRRSLVGIGFTSGCLLILLGGLTISAFWHTFPIVSLGVMAWGVFILSYSSYVVVEDHRKRNTALASGV
ncbi:MAG TPA: WD40 repeat domain-containing protein [Terriglobia bacterium]|nr:WD40 repeat domain-containing protein [Terriglobia bacterium]